MEQVEKMCDNICLINKGKPVLSGELHEIKKRYGTNSIRLEYEGDGEFLKNLIHPSSRHMGDFIAELELIDISKSSELLASLNGRISLRKFEIVEPCLNSIFINIVGGPDKIEQASSQSIPTFSPVWIAEQVNHDQVEKINAVSYWTCCSCRWIFRLRFLLRKPAMGGACDFISWCHCQYHTMGDDKEKGRERINDESIAGGTVMKSKALQVAIWEFSEKVKSKAFIISLVIMPVIMILFGVIPELLPRGPDESATIIGIIDETGSIVDPLAKRMDEKYKLPDGKPNYVIRNFNVQGYI